MAQSLNEVQGEPIKMFCPILAFVLFKKHNDRVKKTQNKQNKTNKNPKPHYSTLKLKIIILDKVKSEVP